LGNEWDAFDLTDTDDDWGLVSLEISLAASNGRIGESLDSSVSEGGSGGVESELNEHFLKREGEARSCGVPEVDIGERTHEDVREGLRENAGKSMHFDGDRDREQAHEEGEEGVIGDENGSDEGHGSSNWWTKRQVSARRQHREPHGATHVMRWCFRGWGRLP
jgi:hypothetical protein